MSSFNVVEKPDFDQYDCMEIQACLGDDPCDIHAADRVTLYGHLRQGGVEAIHDFKVGQFETSSVAWHDAYRCGVSLTKKHALPKPVQDNTMDWGQA